MEFRLAGTEIIEPLRQGDADGLCGLYAAINSIRLVSAPVQPLTQSQSMQLAYEGFEYLKQRRKLETAIGYGMGCSLQKKLLKHTIKRARKLTGLSIQSEKIEVTKYNWQEKISENIKNDFAINLVLEGAYDHFTVISGLTKTKFMLFDSLQFKWVNKSNCYLGGSTSNKRHAVNSKSLIATKVLLKRD